MSFNVRADRQFFATWDSSVQPSTMLKNGIINEQSNKVSCRLSLQDAGQIAPRDTFSAD